MGQASPTPRFTHHVPLVDRVLATNERRHVEVPADIVTLYDEMVDGQRDNVVRAVEIVAAHVGDGPVLVHCTAGKDRTGIVVALVQAAIGVPLDAIVEDYVRSDSPTRLRRIEMLANPLPDDPDVAAAPELIWTAPGEAMELFATGSDRTVRLAGSVAHRARGLTWRRRRPAAAPARGLTSPSLRPPGAAGSLRDGGAIADDALGDRRGLDDEPLPSQAEEHLILRQPRARRVLDQ